MANTSLLRARPLLVTALDTLEALGGRAPVDKWMAAHPDLQALRSDERGKIARALHDNGYIEKAGWVDENRRGSDGRKHGIRITIWRLKTWHH